MIIIPRFHQLNLIVEVAISFYQEEAKAVEKSREEDEVVSSMTLSSLVTLSKSQRKYYTTELSPNSLKNDKKLKKDHSLI